MAGNGTREVVVTGSLANINAWKAEGNALVYQGVLDYNGPETLTINYRDGSPVATANLTATQQSGGFNVVAVNDPPVISMNTGLTVTQAATATTPVTTIITNIMLAATDVDDAATAITYTVQTAPGSGTLKLNNAPLTACATVPATSTFTQQQLNDGLVEYVTALGTPPLDGSFTFVVGNSPSCGGTAETFTITVNAP